MDESTPGHRVHFAGGLPVDGVTLPWGSTRAQAGQAVAAAVAAPWGRFTRGWQVEVTAPGEGELVARGKVRHTFTITPPLVVWP